MKKCKYCLNSTNSDLTPENDLAYCVIGKTEKHYSILLRTGNKKPTAIIIEKYNEKTKRNNDIGYYIPKYCPECGRKLIENNK